MNSRPKKRAGSLQIEELSKGSELVDTRRDRSSVISKTSCARRVHYLKVKDLNEQEEMQGRRRCEVKQSCERLEKVAFQEAFDRKLE